MQPVYVPSSQPAIRRAMSTAAHHYRLPRHFCFEIEWLFGVQPASYSCWLVQLIEHPIRCNMVNRIQVEISISRITKGFVKPFKLVRVPWSSGFSLNASLIYLSGFSKVRKRDKEVGMKLRNPEKTPGRRHESLPNDLELTDIEARSSSFASLIKLI